MRNAGFNIHRFDSLDSTNAKAKRYPPGNVIVAKEQTKGRGRFKREWNSSKGGVYMSIIVGVEIKKAKFLTLLAAIAVQHSLVKLYNIDAKIKWPNDIMLNDKKLCGILTESQVSGQEAKMIIGIGINTNNIIRSELSAIAISLHESGFDVDNEELIRELVDEFSDLYEKAHDDPQFVLKEWKRLSYTLGKRVHVLTQQDEFFGYAVDIDDECNLIIEKDDGKKERIVEGDIFTA